MCLVTGSKKRGGANYFSMSQPLLSLKTMLQKLFLFGTACLCWPFLSLPIPALTSICAKVNFLQLVITAKEAVFL